MQVTCPCCKGKKRLSVVKHHDDDGGRTWLEHPICTHCMGKGVIAVEVEEP